MSQFQKSVTVAPQDLSRLPDWAAAGCAHVQDLEARGMLGPLGDRLQIRREGGYAGIDILLVLLFFFGGRLGIGFRPFWRHASPHALQLGALAGRQGLSSSSSVSRALKNVETEMFRPLIPWLLAEVTGADEILRHPAVLTRDACGQGWHVFHFDPTVTALRQRSLPAGKDLPEPRRHTDEMAVPGYHGRKRGELVFRRAMLEHSSSIWIHGTATPGNGDGRTELAAAVDAVVTTCVRIDHPVECALLLMDGEWASVPSYTTARERKLAFITRFVRYALLDEPEIRARMASGAWLDVPSDRSGPRRSAMDLGIVTVHPGEGTVRADGSRYEPVSIRVVVSRYARTGEPEHGRVIDGWQYELFAADLDPTAWPAPDVVHTFFSRSGQENRFAQEDRELGLDRIFSYHLPGQEFACIVGLMTWNLRVVAGFRLAPPPVELPAAAARERTVDPRPSVPAPAVEPEEPEQAEPPPSEPGAAEARMIEQLAAADWLAWETKNPGWKWRGEIGQLACPQGKPLRLATVDVTTRVPGGKGQLTFSSREGACRACPIRSACTRAKDEGTRKMIGVNVEMALARKIRRSLAAARPHRSPLAPPARRKASLAVAVAVGEAAAGPHSVTHSLFLPAEARKLFEYATRALAVRVVVSLPTRVKRTALLASSPGDRQHRRKTWAEHLARYALPDGARVDVCYECGPAARRLIPDGSQGLVAK